MLPSIHVYIFGGYNLHFMSLSKVLYVSTLCCMNWKSDFLYYIFCKVEYLMRFALRPFPELSSARSRLMHRFYLDSRFLVFICTKDAKKPWAWVVCLIEHHNNPVSKIQIFFLYLIIRMWQALRSFGSVHVCLQQNCQLFSFFFSIFLSEFLYRILVFNINV